MGSTEAEDLGEACSMTRELANFRDGGDGAGSLLEAMKGPQEFAAEGLRVVSRPASAMSVLSATDVVNYAFLGIWILLCGVMLCRKRAMWQACAAAALYELLSRISLRVSHVLLPPVEIP